MFKASLNVEESNANWHTIYTLEKTVLLKLGGSLSSPISIYCVFFVLKILPKLIFTIKRLISFETQLTKINFTSFNN